MFIEAETERRLFERQRVTALRAEINKLDAQYPLCVLDFIKVCLKG